VNDRYYTVAEAAEHLSVSHDTILRLIHAGTLPAIKVSERIYRIPRPAMARYESGVPVVRRGVVRRRLAKGEKGIEFGARDRQRVGERR
jgi:excisionase family DNA binding protein